MRLYQKNIVITIDLLVGVVMIPIDQVVPIELVVQGDRGHNDPNPVQHHPPAEKPGGLTLWLAVQDRW